MPINISKERSTTNGTTLSLLTPRDRSRRANLLIFPNLEAANIGFNLVRMTADASVIGPIMLGSQHPAYLMQPHSSGVSDVVHLTALAATEAHGGQRAKPVLARI